MKRKNYIFSLALALLMGTLTMSLTACSNEDIVANNTQQPAQGEVRTYTVSIPATIGGDEAQTRAVDFSGTDAVGKPTAIATFATTDKIYVYKKSPSPAWLSWNSETSSFDYLSPNKAGTNCTLTGSITGQFAVGDVLELYYNMERLDSDPANCAFVCDIQDGTASGIPDYAIATVKVKSIDAGNITFCQESGDDDETAHFDNLLSMFRFSFTDGSNSISVKRVKITSDNDAIFSRYLPMESPALYVPTYSWPIIATLPAPTTDNIYVGIGINENKSSVGAVMNFEVEDADGKVYTGTKAAPAAGFAKGKYYYSTSPVTVAYQFTRQNPTITWTTPSTPVEPNMHNIYDIGDNNFDITLSGTSNGYGFCMLGNSSINGTVSLNGLTASYYDNEFFIYQWGDLTINLLNGSSNSITCPNTGWCIGVDDGTLKLSGNGTLTVTANSNSCGLYGDSNYDDSSNNYSTTTEVDVTSQLAAPGHTVTRSARTDNGGGSYTWTYTVAPALGYLYYSDGTYSSTLIDGKTPIGVIAYLDQPGPDDDEITEKSQGAGHGLVLCLKNAATNVIWSTEKNLEFPGKETTSGDNGVKRTTDVSGYTYTSTLAAKTDAETKYPALYIAKNYSELPAPSGTTGWFLPSAQQWVRMQIGVGGLNLSDVLEGYYTYYDSGETCFQHFNSALSKAGDGNFNPLQPYEWYWTSSENDNSTAIELQLGEDDSRTDKGFYWTGDDKANPIDKVYSRVRTVLAF